MANKLFIVIYPLLILTGVRKRIENHIQEAFREEIDAATTRRYARKTIHNWAVNAFELMFFYHPSNRKNLIAKVEIDGLEKINQAKKDGTGVIGLSAHFGNFPLMMLRLSIEDVNMSFLFSKEFVRESMAAMIKDGMMRYAGLNMIMTRGARNAAMASVREIRRSGFVIIIADESRRKRGVEVQFFGRPTNQAPGPAFISLKTGAAMLPLFIVRKKNGRHRIMIEDPVKGESGGNDYRDIADLTQKRLDIIEKYVRRYPELWLWVHSPWRKRKGDKKRSGANGASDVTFSRAASDR